MNMSFKSFFWIFPFLSFLLGYYSLFFWLSPVSRSMPLLVGKPAIEALIALSEYRLIPCVIAYKEKSGLPHGTILEQTPAWQSPVKEHQSVYLVLSQEPQEEVTPDLIGKNITDIQSFVCESRYTIECMFVPHASAPQDQCFAMHVPPAFIKKNPKKIIAFIAKNEQSVCVWPNFKKMALENAIAFLDTYDIKPTIIYADNESHYNDWYIYDQQPTAGTFVEQKHLKKLPVQFLVKKREDFYT